MTQILIEKHPEILPHHQLGRVVATVSHPLPRPDLDVHADVVRVAGDVEFWTGELQSGAVDRILIGSLAFDLIEVRQLLELELIACVHHNLSLGESVLADHVFPFEVDILTSEDSGIITRLLLSMFGLVNLPWPPPAS